MSSIKTGLFSSALVVGAVAMVWSSSHSQGSNTRLDQPAKESLFSKQVCVPNHKVGLNFEHDYLNTEAGCALLEEHLASHQSKYYKCEEDADTASQSYEAFQQCLTDSGYTKAFENSAARTETTLNKWVKKILTAEEEMAAQQNYRQDLAELAPQP